MQTSSQVGKKSRRLAVAGAFLCAALMLSLAESVAFPTGILPIPGAKPGLANAAVLMCATLMGLRYAASVSAARVILMFFLFGSATSVIYSLAGAAVSFVGIALLCNNGSLSFFGKSIIAAILHNLAQLCCAMLIIGPHAAVLVPWMILSGVLCGGFTGLIINLCFAPVSRQYSRITQNTIH